MQGRRIYKGDDLNDVEPGDYWKWSDRSPNGREGYWLVALPIPPIEYDDGDSMPYLGTLNPNKHSITEHDDGTITVSPSILVFNADGTERWHGYLERGIWRTV